MSEKKRMHTGVTIAGIIFLSVSIIVIILVLLLNILKINIVGKDNIIIYIGILCCIMIVPLLFNVFKIKKLLKRDCYLLQSIYLVLPLVLILQINNVKEINIIGLVGVSMIMACLIYKVLKDAEEVNIQYLKFSNLVLSTAFTIICFLIDLLFDGTILNIKLLLFIVYLLSLLKVVYEKVDLVRKNDNAKSA
jgi:hypothetical protein